jgi:hypothetical protein
MLDTTKTEPFTAKVNSRAQIEGQDAVSLDGRNSWYFVPGHLAEVIEQATKGKRALIITTSRSEILSAELGPAPRFALAGLGQFMYEASAVLGRLKDRINHRPPAPSHHTPKM